MKRGINFQTASSLQHQTPLDLTEKIPTFSVKKTMVKPPQTIDSKIRSRIYGHGKGWVFTPKHFQGLGSVA